MFQLIANIMNLYCAIFILQLFEMAIISHMQYIAMCCNYVSHTNNANVVLIALCDNVNTMASALPYCLINYDSLESCNLQYITTFSL